MIEISAVAREDAAAPPPALQPIDFTHLSRMTLGDSGLAREVLDLFDRQARMLIDRMAGAQASAVSGFAHTIKGSARGIGAWSVAREAEALERLAPQASAADLKAATDRLAAAVDDARSAMAGVLLPN
jgi:HPt (histidine-containing phosphotransfer) domain-containing protein